MNKHADICINKEISVKESIKLLDQTAKKIILLLEDNILIGTITDGDIRRWILKNGSLSTNAKQIANLHPITTTDKSSTKRLLKKHDIEAIPVVDNNNHVEQVIFWNEVFENKFISSRNIDSPVVIMAGGKGTRLYPYTKILPKPLIPIGDTPIVERIINKFRDYGCSNFYLTVNYKKEMILSYFDGIEKSYTLDFIEENKPLGTAGSLRYFKDKINSTFFVNNCDILINADYSDILKYHKKNKNKITLVTSLKHITIPYGVVSLNKEETIETIIEKPEYDFLINTGMYLLEPDVLNHIPKDTFFHITDLVKKYIKQGDRVGTYPVSEDSWMDMGQFKEMEQMIKKIDSL